MHRASEMSILENFTLSLPILVKEYCVLLQE